MTDQKFPDVSPRRCPQAPRGQSQRSRAGSGYRHHAGFGHMLSAKKKNKLPPPDTCRPLPALPQRSLHVPPQSPRQKICLDTDSETV